MSFILDALKKSEADRQQKNRPASAHIPTAAAQSSSSRWLLIVGALLLINVVVLLVVFLKPDPASVDTLPATITETRQVEQVDSFRDLVANARDRQTSSAVAKSAPSTPAPLASDRERTAIDTPASVPSLSATTYKTFNEVRANGSVQLPDLHLDLHVYDSVPGARFVFINMNKYVEKATLEEGPLVAEIVPEGVILEYLGTRFLLPRE
jgi:general secretion pathway protein B